MSNKVTGKLSKKDLINEMNDEVINFDTLVKLNDMKIKWFSVQFHTSIQLANYIKKRMGAPVLTPKMKYILKEANNKVANLRKVSTSVSYRVLMDRLLYEALVSEPDVNGVHDIVDDMMKLSNSFHKGE